METTEKAKVMNLPIFKHFDQSDIAIKGQNMLTEFRKGEKPIYRAMQIGAVGAVGYFSWVYVLPAAFMALGQMVALAITGISIVFLVLAAPAIFKALRRSARALHKSVIKQRPFEELAEQREKMVANEKILQQNKQEIVKLKDDMENESSVNEQKAKDYQESILKKQAKAEKLKLEMEEMVRKSGADAKGTDEYVAKNAEFFKVVSAAQREAQLMEQSKNFISKYGSRYQIMQKLVQRLTMAEAGAEIKIGDFDATVEILKNDSMFASKTKQATQAAKNAMMFTKSWELEYALDVVQSTIASDISATAVNMNDIGKLTANFDMNSDEMFADLDKLANNIRVGNDIVPEAKKYKNTEYVLTGEDKRNSGGFGNIFE